jgi:hypothetical protein
MSAADVVLSAIAARTSRLRVGSAVSVLSSDDPVRSTADDWPPADATGAAGRPRS